MVNKEYKMIVEGQAMISSTVFCEWYQPSVIYRRHFSLTSLLLPSVRRGSSGPPRPATTGP